MVKSPRFKRVAVAVACVAAMILMAGTIRAQTSSSTGEALNHVLAQMNEASAKFHSTKADFQWDQFERVIDGTDTQTGAIYFVRSGEGTKMAAYIETYDGQPSKKVIVFQKGVLQYYQPSIDQLTVVHTRDKKAQYESYMTLGFGGSGKDLEKSWNITYEGTETIGGIKTAKLDLVSKSEAVRKNFTHVTVWIDPARAISLKQILFEPSGNTRTAYYRKIEYNKNVPSAVFRVKTNSKTHVVEK